MKKIILATLVATYCVSAFAESTAVLKVQGTLTNAACTISLSNGGVIDYGYIHLGELSATDNNKIGQKQIPATISCTAPTKVAFTIMDNKTTTNALLPVDFDDGTLSNNYATLGIGTTSGDVKIGSYGLSITDSIVDGKTVDTIKHNNDWAATKWSKYSHQRTDGFSEMSFATTGTLEPLAFEQAAFNISSNLIIKDTTTLAITDDTPLDGQATMTLVYL
ncbi:TPA: DUF1120 domain-containing protein [Enterobacter cloacae]|nr:DUF1120 domain-containing protein [Enterobacter cloacae]